MTCKENIMKMIAGLLGCVVLALILPGSLLAQSVAVAPEDQAAAQFMQTPQSCALTQETAAAPAPQSDLLALNRLAGARLASCSTCLNAQRECFAWCRSYPPADVCYYPEVFSCDPAHPCDYTCVCSPC
jgi:hypothetical protein